MDIDRDERLREMGLAPVWQRRNAHSPPVDVSAEQQTAAPAMAVAAERSAPPVAAGMTEAPPSALRELEIAVLPWERLVPDVAACTACGLCRTRNKTVLGVGVSTARWMFVGEAPGSEEDALGEPFVGQAGRLLDNMLTAIGLSRTRDVYIANVLKCRPPGNRNPEPEEVARCAPYLERQLALIQPSLVVALGRFAALTLLNTESTIAALRGRVHAYRGVPLIVTYHPAYLLRNLPDKAKAWEDLLFAKRTFAGLQSAESSPP